MNLLAKWEDSTDDILLPILIHSESLLSTSSSDYSTAKEDKKEEYFKPIHEVDINDVIFEAKIETIDHVFKKRRNIMTQKLTSTAVLCTKRMVSKFTRKIHDWRCTRVN